MSGNACPMEPDVVRAAAMNAWPHALRSHIESCQECAAAADVAPWMQSFAEVDVRQTPLPDPALLFLKAQLLKNTVAVDRASRPIARFQIVAYLVVAAGWAALLMTRWTTIASFLSSLTPAGLMSKMTSGGAASLSMSIVVTVVALASMTVMLALHTILAEE